MPRSVTFKTNGPKVRVYLILSSLEASIDKMTIYMVATDAIAKGLKPNTETVAQRAVSVNQGIFHLSSWSWIWHPDHMLIVFAGEEAQVVVRLSYGT